MTTKLQKIWKYTDNQGCFWISLEKENHPTDFKEEQLYTITAEQLRDVIEDSYYECIEEQPIEEAKKQILKELGVEDE